MRNVFVCLSFQNILGKFKILSDFFILGRGSGVTAVLAT